MENEVEYRRALRLLRATPGERSEPTEALNEREGQVLELARQGLQNKEIGDQLGLSHHTVANHLTEVYRKLHVRGRRELRKQRARISAPCGSEGAIFLSRRPPATDSLGR